MESAFRHLHMPHELACEFLAVFSRFEYALKSTEYAYGNEGKVEPWWDKFSNDIDGAFNKITEPEFLEATDYLLKSPPRKQALSNDRIIFNDQTIDNNQAKAHQVFKMIRTVRNNLFHGGKYLPNGEMEEGRNKRLVESSLLILKSCVHLHPHVGQSYEH